MSVFNKATAAALAGAVATGVAMFFSLDAEVSGALATILSTLLVWFVPNK